MTVQNIALKNLIIAKTNNRGRDPAKIAALAASIEVVGLIQPLSGYREGKKTVIDAGGYRLAALQLLADDGRLPADLAEGIPVNVAASADMTLARTIAENEVRDNLHPIDRLLLYRAMFDQGAMDAVAIAKACAVSADEVKRLLRLRGVADPILEACKAGRVSLDVVKVYSITEDQALQLSVFEALGDDAAHWEVRRRLADGYVSAGGPLARFVGLDAYEAAGGALLVDLFSGREVADWADGALAQRLCDEKLKALAADLAEREGWLTGIVGNPATARTLDDRPYVAMPGETVTIPDEVIEAYDLARDMLEDAEGGADDLDPFEVLAAWALTVWVEDNHGKVLHSEDQKSRGAVFVWFEHGVQISRGWEAPVPAEGSEGSGEAAEALDGPENGAGAPSEPKLGEDEGWGHSGHKLLTSVATASVRARLMTEPGAAYDIALAHMAVAILHHGDGQALTFRPSMVLAYLNGDRDPWLESREGWQARIPSGFAAALDVIAAMKPKDKADLFAFCVAGSLDAVEPGLHHYERKAGAWRQLGQIARFLGHDVSDNWTPDAATLEKVSKPGLMAALAGIGSRRHTAADKRSAMAATLARLGGPVKWLPSLLSELTRDKGCNTLAPVAEEQAEAA